MSDPTKNRDRVDDEKHRRRREVGSDADDDPDGREVADALYGGPREKCDNCGKRKHNNDDVGCTKCDPRARRDGRPGPVPVSSNQNE